jgi:hypothetical protein
VEAVESLVTEVARETPEGQAWPATLAAPAEHDAPQPTVAPESLDPGRRRVREAILLVASGAARRVVLAGEPLEDEVIDHARRLALEAGVRVKLLSRADAAGHDLAIEEIRT